MIGEYQRDNDQYLKSKSKNRFNKLQYSYKSLETEDYKVFKKYVLKLRKKIKYNLLSFFQSKLLILNFYL